MKKSFKYIGILFLLSISGCSDITDLNSESNINAENFYRNYTEIQIGLTGCYKGMQKPLTEEWSLTELRSDNVIMDSGSSTSTVNNDFQFLDQFFPSSSHQGIYNYWLSTYNNIRNTNVVLNAVGAKYNASTGVIDYEPIDPSIATATQCQSIAAEASFIRAYHYFNLVRLYGTDAIANGGVFLVDKVLSPEEAKKINRSSLDDIYKFIIADLKNAMDNGNKATYSSQMANNPDQLGHANSWAAKALLAKVYLTRYQAGDKDAAVLLLNEIISSSGYNLLTTSNNTADDIVKNYSDVFSVFNEMNKEILFAIRFKGGGLGMGNPLPNLFAPSNSGNAVMNGDGKGYNNPTPELIDLFKKDNIDARRDLNIGQHAKIYAVNSAACANSKNLYLASYDGIKVNQYISGPGLSYGNKVKSILIDPITKLKYITLSKSITIAANTPLIFYTSVYANKFMSKTALAFDAENDFPVIRFSDVLLMLAEAEGRTGLNSLININKVRKRAGLLEYISFTSDDDFEKKLSLERRLEFAFENQRWFDLLRYNKTFKTSTNKVIAVMKAHFTSLSSTYTSFVSIPITLTDLINNVTNHTMLLIPQYEIDTNSNIVIEQNYK